MRLLKDFRKFVAIKIENIVLKTLYEQNQNINAERQRKALAETVDYISVEMAGVQSLSNKEEVLKLATNAGRIKGLVLEFGVFSGYTINFISNLIKPGIVYGFDSFQGLPENWRDGFPKGKFETAKLPVVNPNVELVVGLFDDTLPVFLESHKGPVSLLHIDCDLYSSTKTILSLLNDRITNGTVIIFDEYFNYPGWKDGEFKAFQEFVKAKGLKYKYLTYNNRHEQVALIVES